MALAPLFSILSYGFLIFLFASALAKPAAHLDVVYKLGISVYVFEFLSLHSAAMFHGTFHLGREAVSVRNLLKAGLFCVYFAFAFAFSSVVGSYAPVLFFCTSLLGKIFSPSRRAEEGLKAVQSAILLLATTFVVVLVPFSSFFPFPPEVLAQKPSNASGLFVEAPQRLLVWGILYFGFLCAFETYAFLKLRKEKNK